MELFRVQNVFASLSVNEKEVYVTNGTMLNAVQLKSLCRVVDSVHTYYRT
jgi:threonine aldolase